MMRKFGAMVVAAALLASQTAFAADTSDAVNAPQIAPLAPGTAAGLQAAQNDGPNINKVVIVVGVGLGALAIYLITGTHYKVPPQNSSAGGTK